MNCPKVNLLDLSSYSCKSQVYQNHKLAIDLKNNKVYLDGNLYGDIISQTKKSLKVKLISSNKYLNGQVTEITLNL